MVVSEKRRKMEAVGVLHFDLIKQLCVVKRWSHGGDKSGQVPR